jgi:subtilisin family serine protease
MPVRVTNEAGVGTADQAGAGIIWATDHGADVCNVSLQFYNGDLTWLESSVNYADDAGVLVIAAAGNSHPGVVAAPGRFANCIAVSATTDYDGFASFSNYGPEIELCAPGASIWSTRPNDNYGWEGGTSMAAPHVSGLAALIKSYAYYLTNQEIRTILRNTVDDLGPAGRDHFFGFGRVNAFAALSAVTPSIGIVSSDPPNGAIDARQPYAVDGTNADGWDGLEVVFDGAATGLTAADFVVATDPPRTTPLINAVEVDGDAVLIQFDAAIPIESWTILTHSDSNTSARIASLPGDVNGDGTTTIGDLDILIDDHAGLGDSLPAWSTDLNRSGETNAQDILRQIDLLNGAGEYPSFMDATLDP